MTKIWVASDHHFNHANILNFKREDGSPLREFKDVTDMNEALVRYHNELVRPEDHVYFLGDFAINKKGLEYAKRMMGHKRLVRGNHDIFKTREYIEAGFDEIYGVRVWPKQGLVFSHVPLHPASLADRGWKNIHGHLHSNVVKLANGQPDTMYQNVCVEQINYRPILMIQ